MGRLTEISWCDHTFNPWWGCARKSKGCRFCYAETLSNRYGLNTWGAKGPRRMLSDDNWRQPLKWNRDAEKTGVPARVFCASMADVFEDHHQLPEPRARLWDLIAETTSLRWLLLTKRPENVNRMAPWGSDWPPHVWLGTSIEDQEAADERLPLLRDIPAAVRFVSAEPLLEYPVADWSGVNWLIVGGESGSKAKARPMDPEWARRLVADARNVGAAPFVKQLGSVWSRTVPQIGIHKDMKGANWDRWPADLRVREFPAEVTV